MCERESNDATCGVSSMVTFLGRPRFFGSGLGTGAFLGRPRFGFGGSSSTMFNVFGSFTAFGVFGSSGGSSGGFSGDGGESISC